jgi:hypothetical protein
MNDRLSCFVSETATLFRADQWAGKHALTLANQFLAWKLSVSQEVVLASGFKLGANGDKPVLCLNVWVDMAALFAQKIVNIRSFLNIFLCIQSLVRFGMCMNV